MTKEKIVNICNSLDGYLSSKHIPPGILLIGKKKKESEKSDLDFKVSSVSFTKDDAQKLNQILNEFSKTVRGFIEGEYDFHEFNGAQNSSLLYKPMKKAEAEYLNSGILKVDNSADISDYLKTRLRSYLVIYLTLNAEGTKKLLLFKKITSSYYNVKQSFVFNPFESNKHITLLDSKKDILLDRNFEVTAFIDETSKDGSFFFITDRDEFEDLFNYHQRYEEAYEALSKTCPFIDWSMCKKTTPLLRKCFCLASHPRVGECIDRFKGELANKTENPITYALKTKEIKYGFTKDGELHINPTSTTQLKTLLKIIDDGVIKTYLLGREGITEEFEEL